MFESILRQQGHIPNLFTEPWEVVEGLLIAWGSFLSEQVWD